MKNAFVFILIKKILIAFIISMSSIFLISAQGVIPNGGFEHWSSVAQGEDPDSLWFSPNQLSIEYPILVAKSTDAFAGNYALYVKSDTATLPPPAGINTLDTLSGFLGLNFNFTQGNSLGVAFTGRPKYLSAYIKANIPPGSNSNILLSLTNSNGVVGVGRLSINCSISTYTKECLPIFYFGDDEMPTTMAITIFAGDGRLPILPLQSNLHPVPGNEIWIDELKFSLTNEDCCMVNTEECCIVDTDDFGLSEKVKIYPIPARHQLTIEIESEQTENKEYLIKISDLSGKTLEQHHLLAPKMTIDISNLQPGFYTLMLFQENLNLAGAFKMIKVE